MISRYHGGAYVVFSATLNDNMRVAALEGSRASVIGGAPAAAVRITPDGRRALIVFKRDNKVGLLHIRGETVTHDPAGWRGPDPGHGSRSTSRASGTAPGGAGGSGVA